MSLIRGVNCGKNYAYRNSIDLSFDVRTPRKKVTARIGNEYSTASQFHIVEVKWTHVMTDIFGDCR
jgi:hypothetical protein